MNNVTFGRYSPLNTFTHKVDPRNKILILILLMVSIFLQFHVWSTTLLLSGVFLILLICLMLISKVNFLDLFKSLKSMWFLVIFLLVIYVFIPNPTYKFVCYRFNDHYAIYWDSFYQSGYIILRLILMISLTMVLTSTTKPMDLTYAFEWYMTPLKVIRFPVHEIAMTLSIALRFIPILVEETDKIMKAQMARGADFESGGVFKRAKNMVPILVPLFVSAFRRANDLALAMEARCYNGGEGRTKMKPLSYNAYDHRAYVIEGLFLAATIVSNILYNRYVSDLFANMLGM